MFRVHVVTLYPEMFPGFLGMSMAGRALIKKHWALQTHPIRDFSMDKHRTVDDTPAGGGAGMVLKADVLARAIDSTPPDLPRYLLSPRGEVFTQEHARHLARGSGITLVCGRFEGVDERVISKRNLKEISVGDYILSGGEPAALIVMDTIMRLLPGVMGNRWSAHEESFENFLLEYPHYTRPQCFEGEEIPAVLTSGNHQAVREWRRVQAENITRKRRPDLYALYQATKQARKSQITE